MPLLNYTTKVPAQRTVTQISTMLAKKGALEISTTYGNAGQPAGLRWVVNTAHGPMTFALPVNVYQVYQVLTKQRVMATNDEARMEQAHRTAWRIIQDWVQAQMALLETEMVQMEEIFLPYMLEGDKTLYQYLKERNFPALQPGQPE